MSGFLIDDLDCFLCTWLWHYRAVKDSKINLFFLNLVAAICGALFAFNSQTLTRQWYIVQRLCNSMHFLFWVWASCKIQKLLPVWRRGQHQWLLVTVSIPPGLRNMWSPGVLSAPLGFCWQIAGGYGSNIDTDSCSSWALLRLFGNKILCGFCHTSLAICLWKFVYFVGYLLKMYMKVFPNKSSCICQFAYRTPSYFKLFFSAVTSAHFLLHFEVAFLN